MVFFSILFWTIKIKTLALTGPIIGIEYIYIEVPNDIAPADTKKKLTRKVEFEKIAVLNSLRSTYINEIIDVNK